MMFVSTEKYTYTKIKVGNMENPFKRNIPVVHGTHVLIVQSHGVPGEGAQNAREG